METQEEMKTSLSGISCLVQGDLQE